MKRSCTLLFFYSSFFFSQIFAQNISVNTTGAANTTSSMFEVLQPTGAVNNSIGLYLAHAGNNPANTYYGLQSFANGTAGTNHIAGYFSASGATNNYALIVPSAGGSVGIGTTAPTAKLHVNAGDIGVGRIDGGDITPYARLGLSNGYEQYLANNAYYQASPAQWNFVNTGGYGGMASMLYQVSGTMQFLTANNAANPVVWSNRMYIGNNGYIGIATTGPTEQLEVNATSGTGGIMITAQPDAHIDSRSLTTGKNFDLIGSYMGWDQNAIYIGGYNAGNSTRSANKVYCGGPGGPLDFYGTNNIYAANNAGIGTTTPAERLEVSGNQKFSGWARLYNGASNFHIDASPSGSLYLDYYSGGGVYFGDGASGGPNGAWTSGGNVGIGTTGPAVKLEIASGNNTEFLRMSKGSGNPFQILFGDNLAGVSNAQGVVYFEIGGSETFVMGGHTIPDANTRDLGAYPNNMWQNLYVNDFWINSCGIWGSSWYWSDERFKKNISPMTNVLLDLMKLQGVKFNWRKDEFPDKHFDDNRHIGFIAQEVEKIFPEVVNTNKEGYKNIDYGKLTAVLTEAIKEQQKMIDELKTENGNLKNSNDNQKKEIDNLNNKFSGLEAMVKTLQLQINPSAGK